jgi:lipopolysaccharide biosynthesis glycosyltransferase
MYFYEQFKIKKQERHLEQNVFQVLVVQSNHYKYMVLIKVIAIDLFSVVKCEKSCSD